MPVGWGRHAACLFVFSFVLFVCLLFVRFVVVVVVVFVRTDYRPPPPTLDQQRRGERTNARRTW